MGFAELFFIAVGLSMDAFAVSVCIGLSLRQATIKNSLIVGMYFGAFQGFMPLIGYLAGSRFSGYVERFDHWIAFILLSIIGGKMILGSFQQNTDGCNTDVCDDNKNQACVKEASLAFAAMFPLAVATSIDALAVGVTFAFLQVKIVSAVSFIGIITLTLSMAGVKIGKAFGSKLKAKAELFGGVVLVLIGLKILLEHLNII